MAVRCVIDAAWGHAAYTGNCACLAGGFVPAGLLVWTSAR